MYRQKAVVAESWLRNLRKWTGLQIEQLSRVATNRTQHEGIIGMAPEEQEETERNFSIIAY